MTTAANLVVRALTEAKANGRVRVVEGRRKAALKAAEALAKQTRTEAVKSNRGRVVVYVPARRARKDAFPA